MRGWLKFNRLDLVFAGCYFGWGTDYLANGRYWWGAGFIALSLVIGISAWRHTK